MPIECVVKSVRCIVKPLGCIVKPLRCIVKPLGWKAKPPGCIVKPIGCIAKRFFRVCPAILNSFPIGPDESIMLWSQPNEASIDLRYDSNDFISGKEEGIL